MSSRVSHKDGTKHAAVHDAHCTIATRTRSASYVRPDINNVINDFMRTLQITKRSPEPSHLLLNYLSPSLGNVSQDSMRCHEVDVLGTDAATQPELAMA